MRRPVPREIPGSVLKEQSMAVERQRGSDRTGNGSGRPASRIGKAGLHHGVVLAVSIPLLSACFTYVPVELEAIPAGGDVRVYLSRTGIAGLPEEIRSNGSYVAGSLVGRETQNLTVRVAVADQAESVLYVPLRQDVLIPTQDVVELRRRQLDGMRTGLLVAASAGAAAAIMASIMDASGSDRRQEEIPELTRIPLFVLRFR
jgi:hypothetical protein